MLDRCIVPVCVQASSRAFQYCPGCSAAVLSEYSSRGVDFLMDVFNVPGYLEKASGLDKYHAATEATLTEWDGDDAEAFDDADAAADEDDM